jgi:hypothetical protein
MAEMADNVTAEELKAGDELARHNPNNSNVLWGDAATVNSIRAAANACMDENGNMKK